jgi:hypothetical protein
MSFPKRYDIEICGVTRILGADELLKDYLPGMAGSLRRRGPDGRGIWIE